MMEFTALRVPALGKKVAVNLQARLDSLPGIEQFTFALETQELQVIFDESCIDFTTLAREMAKAGCPLQATSALWLRRVRFVREE